MVVGLIQRAGGEDRAAVRIPPPLMNLIGIGLGVALDRLVWPMEVGALGGAAGVGLGAVLVLLGVTANALAFVHFRRTGQNPKPWKPTPALVAQGIYRYSRNPMYVGMGLIQAGIGIATGVLWIAVMVVPVLAAVYFTAIRHEEAYLEKKFGQPYRQYKASVRRWL